MITMEAYWKGPDAQRRDEVYADQVTDTMRANAENTVAKANELLKRAGMEDVEKVNSGFRPRSVNERTRNAGTNSPHLTCEGIDIHDPHGQLDKWCLANLSVLKELGLWMEHPGWTDGWCHVQTRPPGWPPNPNGPRCYIPNNNPPSTTIYGTTPLYA